MELDLQGKVVVVTGASKGIGAAVVDRFAAEGAQVVAAARSATPTRERVHPVTVDLAAPEGPATLVDHVVETLGGIDVLVNNVGRFSARPAGFTTITDAQWQATFEINLFSAVRLIRAAVPSLVERRGAIVNVSSIRARVPQPQIVDYTAAKAALTTVSRALAEELGPRGVRVNTVSPGPTRTAAWVEPDGFGATLAAAAGQPLDEFLNGFAGRAGITTGRMTEPEEVAALVAVLASGIVGNVVGADVVIDGGQSKSA